MPSTSKRHKNRNLAALSPLLKKGGTHQKSKSGKRQKAKNKLKKEVNRLAEQGGFLLGVFTNTVVNSKKNLMTCFLKLIILLRR